MVATQTVWLWLPNDEKMNWKEYNKHCFDLYAASKLPGAAFVGDDVAYADLCERAERVWRLMIDELSHSIDSRVLSAVFAAAWDKTENYGVDVNNKSKAWRMTDWELFVEIAERLDANTSRQSATAVPSSVRIGGISITYDETEQRAYVQPGKNGQKNSW